MKMENLNAIFREYPFLVSLEIKNCKHYKGFQTKEIIITISKDSSFIKKISIKFITCVINKIYNENYINPCFVIEDISDFQLEFIRYKIFDFENEFIEFNCEDFFVEK